MFRVNRYTGRDGRWRWRVWKGAVLLARSTRTYTDTRQLERDLLSLFPQWVKA